MIYRYKEIYWNINWALNGADLSSVLQIFNKQLFNLTQNDWA